METRDHRTRWDSSSWGGVEKVRKRMQKRRLRHTDPAGEAGLCSLCTPLEEQWRERVGVGQRVGVHRSTRICGGYYIQSRPAWYSCQCVLDGDPGSECALLLLVVALDFSVVPLSLIYACCPPDLYRECSSHRCHVHQGMFPQEPGHRCMPTFQPSLWSWDFSAVQSLVGPSSSKSEVDHGRSGTTKWLNQEFFFKMFHSTAKVFFLGMTTLSSLLSSPPSLH